MLSNRWLVLAIVSSALFLIVIDMTVLYTALPRLTHDLGATAAQKLWIVNAYPLVVAGLLPGLGTLGDRLGHKRLFVAGLVVFGIASLAAAYAPSPAALIGARVLLAVGAAMMMPATLSIIRLTFTDEAERAFAIGVWAAVASGGAALGPVIGGVLLEFFWWGSVFLINVPVVVVALVLAVRRVPGGRARGQGPWDLPGSIQIMAGLVGLAYAVKELSRPEPAFGAALAAALVGAAALALFVRRQRRLAHPLIDFALFRNRRFSSGVVAALVASLALIGVELVLTQRFQLVAGLSPLQAGLLILPIPLAAFAAGPIAGLLLPHVGTGRMLPASILLAGLGLAMYLVVLDGPLAAQIVALALLGAGLGAAMTAASTAIMTNAPEARAGMAASVEEVSYELGGAIGIAILGSVLSAVYTATLAVPAGLAAPAIVRDSLDQALIVAEGLPGPEAAALVEAARSAFDQGVLLVLVAAAFILFAVAAGLALVNRRPASLRRAATDTSAGI